MSQSYVIFQVQFTHQHVIALKNFSQSLRVSEEGVLYQNYQEKALHNDSDEDAESKEPKPDKGIVVQFKPIRTSWSQLSVVRNYRKHTHKGRLFEF